VLMTRDRPAGEVPELEDQVQVAVRPGEAVRFLQGVREQLGFKTNDRTIRELVKSGELTATQEGPGRRRSINTASLQAYRLKLEAEIARHRQVTEELRQQQELHGA
jgi:C4-dicarboxylate-specific signal transduction histidine kinase